MKPTLLRLRRWAKPRRRLRAGVTQLIFATAGVGGALLMTRALDGVGPQDIAGRVVNMLIALGVGVLSISAVVFTLLFMVVQWAAGNLSPRLGLFRDDPAVWRTFGYIVGVFLFCFTAAVSIGREQDTSILVAVTAVVLALVAIALIRQLQIKAFASIQLAPTLASITTHGTQILHELTTHAHEDTPTARQLGEPSQTVVWTGPSVTMQQLHIRKLLRLAATSPMTIVMRQPIGTWLMPGTPLCDIHGGQLNPAAVRSAVIAGQEPAFGQDTMFAFRLLADIGLRALSPAVNDPATAVQALDRIHELLQHLTGREPATGVITGDSHQTQLILALPSFDDYLRTGLDDILAARGPTPLVHDRLHALLGDLHERATADQRRAVAVRLAVLDRPSA